MKKIFTFVLLAFSLSAMAQPFYVSNASAACPWGNTNPTCQLIENPTGSGIYTIITAATTGTQTEFKIFNSNGGLYYPSGSNAWFYSTSGTVGFGINTGLGNIVSAVDNTGSLSICAPGPLTGGWTNTNAMTQGPTNTWCVTVASPGTYEWKPTPCASWNSWNLSNGERNVNAVNWSVTTTVANSKVCVTYDPSTGLMTNQVVLPLHITNFSVKNDKNTNKLSWTSETESNSSHFEIEKSIDSKNWAMIGKVEAAGNSLRRQDYNFSDETPSKGANYYRLKMVDRDGSFEYSKVAIANFNGGGKVNIFPNPAQDVLSITISNDVKEATVEIFNTNGQAQIRNVLNGNQLNISELAAGLYFVQISDENGQVISREKLIKN